MSLTVTLNLPHDVEEKLRRLVSSLDADVKEAYALELFRRGQINHFDLSRVLDLDRHATDGWLKQHHVFEGSPTMADLEADRKTLRRVIGASTPHG